LAVDEPFIVGLVGRLDPCTTDLSDNLKRFASNPIFQGIRWRDRPHYDNIDEGSFMDDMEALVAHDLVLDTGFPGAENDEGFSSLLERLPELRELTDH
jgi:L-fuconolactonase